MLVGWTLVLAQCALRSNTSMRRRRRHSRLTPTLVAWLVIALAVAAFFCAAGGACGTFLSAMVALSVLTEVVLSALRLGSTLVLPSSSPAAVALSVFPWLTTPGLTGWLDAALSVSFFRRRSSPDARSRSCAASRPSRDGDCWDE